MAIYGQNYSFGYNPAFAAGPGFQTPYAGYSPVGSPYGAQGAGPLQQLMSSIQQVMVALQQLQGAWQGIAGGQNFNYFNQPGPYTFTPYVAPVSFLGVGPSPYQGPITPSNQPSALMAMGYGSSSTH